MLHNLKNYCGTHFRFVSCIRQLTTTEVSTALRPFYFTVHPDLFEQYPSQRSTNENSLKQLNMLIESLQKNRLIKPTILEFYVRNKNQDKEAGTFRLIKIYLKERHIRDAVLTILKTCNLSTDYIDKIPKGAPPPQTPKIIITDSSKDFSNDPIFGPLFESKIREARDSLTLKKWLEKNYKLAKDILETNRPLMEEIERLKQTVKIDFRLTDIRWDCGWNITHFRGCLQSFMSLVNQHPEIEYIIRGRTLVFAPFTGISLDGHIMLNSGEVRHNWLDLLRNVHKYDAVLLRIPRFERSVSQVLRDIKVGRRKFMPKILAGEYERNLQQITTSLSDYKGIHNFPDEWPATLNTFEIVVETEAGPLMVSPTGQLIVPSSLPGFLLVNFITNHLEEAQQKSNNYKFNKHTERFLHKELLITFKLAALRKDDNITPDFMIDCCQRLLKEKEKLYPLLDGLHLIITSYYSVLTDGIVCIPWNWKL